FATGFMAAPALAQSQGDDGDPAAASSGTQQEPDSDASAAGQEPQEATTAGSAETGVSELDRIVVTGSRIRHEPGYEGPAPVTSIDAETIRVSGQTQIADLVNQLPSVSVITYGPT